MIDNPILNAFKRDEILVPVYLLMSQSISLNAIVSDGTVRVSRGGAFKVLNQRKLFVWIGDIIL